MIENKKLYVVQTLLVILAFAIGLACSAVIVNFYPYTVCWSDCQAAITQEKTFFSDDLIVHSQDSTGKPILIEMSLNRKKIGDFFLHYYYVNMSIGELQKNDVISFQSQSHDVEAHDFLKQFSNTKAPDLSTRESFALTYDHDPISLQITTQDLVGDFITKNSLEYTRYVNEGEATIIISGKDYQARIATVQSYSNDYSKYVYFDGYDSLQSLAQFFVLWDEKQNFYLIDKSEVYSDNQYYKPHTWVLYKDAVTKGANKVFSAQIITNKKGGTSLSWDINIPELNSQISLQSKSIFNGTTKGVVQGTIIRNDFTGKVGGYYSDTEYNK